MEVKNKGNKKICLYLHKETLEGCIKNYKAGVV